MTEERQPSIPITPEIQRAIVRKIKAELLKRLFEDEAITGEEYDRLIALNDRGQGHRI